MTLPEITGKFIEFERKTGICEKKLRGFYFWDALRMSVFSRISVERGTFERGHIYAFGGYSALIRFFVGDFISSFRLWRMLPSKSRVLVFSNSRRKLDHVMGTWIDPYTDPLAERMSPRPLCVEYRKGGQHRKPAYTRRLAYFDLLRYLGALISYLLNCFVRLSPGETNALRKLDQEFQSIVGTPAGLVRAVKQAYCSHKIMVAFYKSMLKRSGAETIVLVCSYGKEALIAACVELDIKTIELQHGTLSAHHLGYHYPEGTAKHYVPDQFWAFGPYWARRAAFPSGMKVVTSFGFPYLSREKARIGNVAKKSQILVISQGIVGDDLSRFLVAALDEIPQEIEVVYKLHPGERVGWRTRYPWLSQTRRISVIEGDSPDLYGLMAASRWQLGVSSTALFEGMAFGCITLLVELPSVEYMADLVDGGAAILLREPRDIIGALQESPAMDPEMFFSEVDWTILDAVSSFDAQGDMRP